MNGVLTKKKIKIHEWAALALYIFLKFDFDKEENWCAFVLLLWLVDFMPARHIYMPSSPDNHIVLGTIYKQHTLCKWACAHISIIYIYWDAHNNTRCTGISSCLNISTEFPWFFFSFSFSSVCAMHWFGFVW